MKKARYKASGRRKFPALGNSPLRGNGPNSRYKVAMEGRRGMMKQGQSFKCQPTKRAGRTPFHLSPSAMIKTMEQKTKKKFGCAILLLGGLYLFFFQLPYIVDPGLRDIHIRRNIKRLNAKDCEVIVAWCEKIYNEKYEELSDREMVFKGEIPEPASRAGYKNAILDREMVKFRAGAGGFSQVGPIVIMCFMDSEKRKAQFLSLDDGRAFNPRTGRLDTPTTGDLVVDPITKPAKPNQVKPSDVKQQDPEKHQP